MPEWKNIGIVKNSGVEKCQMTKCRNYQNARIEKYETGARADPSIGGQSLAPPVDVFQEQEIIRESTGAERGEGVLINEGQPAPLPKLTQAQLESPVILANTEENARMTRIMEERPKSPITDRSDCPFTPPCPMIYSSQPSPEGVQADRSRTLASSSRISLIETALRVSFISVYSQQSFIFNLSGILI
ncbi:hypothetical protein Nepgr_010448 [Nepenthes gracilis]|uniref:Uncharacterized protein n=1 Tax=Nepenthes gracilis TaxID=150966 RepID=A0AAD3XL18_NEPGR|nr:hypothetical protein Nepgr_010448 [Nepenthes gracilis]